jgi:hypothetical protein
VKRGTNLKCVKCGAMLRRERSSKGESGAIFGKLRSMPTVLARRCAFETVLFEDSHLRTRI